MLVLLLLLLTKRLTRV